ncbi:SRPBCC domain-containing protein [Fulvivirgaceae bacterium BMA10]|uniref:SRPBCC domain-containing protein n=1 Tax=Splendidivirga corallicola TaxID=3051826 RepID=A0ABT8KMD5_9BACT|nr:SRPBCC domain-containing protein [Fulvivirgaceae bacterium BMA10]
MKELLTTIDIQAPPEKIWDILTDFDKYPEWNPFIISIRGDLTLNSRLKVYIKPKDSKGMNINPKVVTYTKNKRFSWVGNLAIPGLFEGHHIFEIEPKNEHESKLIHREEFRGLLLPLLWKKLDTQTRAGFEDMNRAIKIKAEQ